LTSFSFSTLRPHPRSTLFPYTTLFRSEIDETLDLSEVVPLIAKPFSPANAFPATEVARERLSFDKAFIGSCTNGGYGDLLEAALDRKSTRLNSSHRTISYAVFCLKKKT